MNDTICFIKNLAISLTGGSLSFWSAENALNIAQSIFVGVAVTVISFIIIHQIQMYWKNKSANNN